MKVNTVDIVIIENILTHNMLFLCIWLSLTHELPDSLLVCVRVHPENAD